MFPGVMTPVPLVKTAVRLDEPPAVIVGGLAMKLEIAGGAGPLELTVTVVAMVVLMPAVLVTVRV